jgi:hypothetical protein
LPAQGTGNGHVPAADLLDWLWKAQHLAERFKVNPTWALGNLAREDAGAVEEVYAVFFLGEWEEPAPRVSR